MLCVPGLYTTVYNTDTDPKGWYNSCIRGIYLSDSEYTTQTPTLDESTVNPYIKMGWSGGAMVLGKLSVPGRPTILITVGQGPTALAVGAGGGGLDIFTLIYPFSPLSPSLWKTVRYRLKYCLKGQLNPKQPTNPYCDHVSDCLKVSLLVWWS